MSYNLFLDDERDPPAGDWVVVRSYAEFVEVIEARGFPNHISFDHDLGPDQESGMGCAKWLVFHDVDHGGMSPTFTFDVHSVNPPGADNIRGLMSGYLKGKAKANDDVRDPE